MEPNDFTVLRIAGDEVPPYSARGVTQTLDPIDAASKLERAVNGQMVDFSIPAMRLYKSRISCSDKNTPAVDGLWPGVVITVECVATLCYPTAEPWKKQRTSVVGSEWTSGNFTFYRPVLTMVCTGWNISEDETSARVSWTYDLEEQG